MNGLVIEGTSVTKVDELYNLNDLHKAAMSVGIATASQRPTNFLLSQHAFIAVAEKYGEAANTVNGGTNPGTFASELIAMKYAGWIDPEYEFKVYRAIQALKHGDIDEAVRLSESKAASDLRQAELTILALNNTAKKLLDDIEVYKQSATLSGELNAMVASGWLSPEDATAVVAICMCPTLEGALTVINRKQHVPMTSDINGWLAESVVLDTEARAPSANLYADYSNWCASKQLRPHSRTVFYKQLAALPNVTKKSIRFPVGVLQGFAGIGLKHLI